MGAKPSSISDLQHNPVLLKLTGETAVAENDEFWEDILAFSFQAPYNSADARLLEEATEPICQRLVGNNLKTGNFVTLIKMFLKRVPELKDSAKCEEEDFTWETYNAILLVRSFSKYFIEFLPNEEVIRQLGGSVVKSQGDEVSGFTEEVLHCTDCGVIEDLICGLVDVIINVPISEVTYPIHVEAINTLLVMLSVQMFDPNASESSIFFQVVMKGKCHSNADDLVKVLLKNFIIKEKTPQQLVRVTNGGWFSGVWSWFGSQSSDEDDSSLLANQSLLLLLVLVNHCTQGKKKQNPYRHALFAFKNRKVKESAAAEDSEEDQEGTPSFTLNTGMLFTAVCRDLHKDQTTLLLYLLLHRNPNVATFILSRTDIDNLVMPILKLLYNPDNHNAHHIYMSLIILLILSQDENFNKSVHELTIASVPWYTERAITNITLGGLLVLVVLRTIQYNMTKMRDKYLHTNCLATLANMSSQFHALHPYVTQRIVSLYALLSKKHAKVMEYIKQDEKNSQQNGEGAQHSDHLSDLAILEEVIRMVLEIINSCVTNTLHHNPNLVYTLLHRRELFAQFRTHPTFHDIIQNIDTVLAFFSARLEQHPDQTLSVGVVLDVIKQGTLQWPRDRLKKFPELKFKYVEEEQPEEFFIPYVWSLVYKSSTLYWNPDHIQLFRPDTEESVS